MTAPAPIDEAQRLDALRDLGILDTPAEERFDRVTRLCQRLFGVPMAYVNFIDHDRQWTKSAAGPALDDLPRDVSFCATVILDGEPLVVEDAAGDPRFATNPLVDADPGIGFYAGVPLSTPNGQRVGTLCIADHAPREMPAADRRLLHDLGAWVEKELSLDGELDKARQVQAAMLPVRPPDDPAWDVAGLCLPSRAVGGDFYDWFSTPGGTVVTLGDVMGKGMPAAILTASVRAALRAGMRRSNLAGGMTFVALSLTDELEATGTFATAVVARLEGDRKIRLVDVGHAHLAVVAPDGTVTEIEAGGLPLGIDETELYGESVVRLGPGEILVLHSDGILELPGGPRSTSDVAAILAGAPSAQAAVDRLAFLPRPPSTSDDITAVAILAAR